MSFTLECQPYLPCRCGNRILLPLTTPCGSTLDRIPWPKGWPKQTFRCHACTRASVYTKNSHVDLHPVQTPESLQSIRDSEVRRISLPCGEPACSGRVEFLFVARSDASRNHNTRIAGNTILEDIHCTIGRHIYNVNSKEEPLFRCETDQEWDALRKTQPPHPSAP